MSLKFVLNDVDFQALTPELQALYGEPTDGKRTLQVQGAVSADRVAELAQQLQTVNNESASRRQALRAYEALGTVDEITEKMDKASKGQNEDHDKIVSDLRTKHDKETKALKTTLAEERQQWALSSVVELLPGAGFLPEGLDLVKSHVKGRIRLDDEGNASYLDKDGQVMIGGGPRGLATTKDFVTALSDELPILVKSDKKGGSGTLPNSGSGTPGSVTIPASRLDAMSGKERAAFFNTNPSAVVAV